MKLPESLIKKTQWTFIGPMGPEVPTDLLSHSLLGVDGGAHFAANLDVWVGDSDSFKETVQCAHQFHFPPEKEFSDLALGLKLFSSALPYHFHFWGFLGGRIDHELINLGEAMAFLETHPGAQIWFYGPTHKILFKLFSKGKWSFNFQGLFSVASIRSSKVQLQGHCRYRLEEETELGGILSLGLSNEAYGEVELNTDNAVMVIFPEGIA